MTREPVGGRPRAPLRSRRAAAVRAALYACVGSATDDELRSRLEVIDAEMLVEPAIAHRVAGRVHARLQSFDVATEVLDPLAAARRDSMAAHLEARRQLPAIQGALDAAGVPGIVFKGPVLASQWYDTPDHREYRDIDVLVGRTGFAAAATAFEEAGFPGLCRNWQGFRDLRIAELPFRAGSMIVDLHWHTVALGAVRDSFEVDIDELFDRRVSVRVGDHEVSTFDPTDTLVQISLHAALAGANRLVWLMDIDRLCRDERLDWAAVVRRANDARVGPPVAAVLQRAASSVGARVDRDVIVELAGGRTWLGVNAAVDRLPMSGKRADSGSHPSMVIMSGRGATTDTLQAFLAGVSRDARRLLRRPEAYAPWDWRPPTGGRPSRDAYYAGVTAGEL
ncbi:MAG: nucleotidyltransferase family protein [Acidimicrobiia bacterium]|nr:nucleotidyltransferase family protein [Acidimicrobiia bacterium]